MRTFETSRTEFERIGPVTVARWEQYRIGEGVMPFDAMWYTVPPGASTPRDCHPELELSIVMAGTAHVEVGGAITEVKAGNAFLLDSEEVHIVHNRDADQPVVVFSGYWMPLS